VGRREDDEKLHEAIGAVEAAVAAGPAGAVRQAALPRVLPSDVARRLETELRARGFVGARYRDEPGSWDLWDRFETVLGLDEDEPRVEWELERRADSRRGR